MFAVGFDSMQYMKRHPHVMAMTKFYRQGKRLQLFDCILCALLRLFVTICYRDAMGRNA